MNRIKRWLCVLLSGMIVLCQFTETRAEEILITDALTTLTIDYKYEGTGIEGCRFKLYKVASMDAEGCYELTGDFTDVPVDLEQKSTDDWDILAETLKAMAAAEEFTPAAEAVTDKNGQVTVENLSVGLYLVVGEKCVQDGYTYWSLPGLTALPSLDQEGRWYYEVTMRPKVDRTKNPEEPVDETTSRRVMKVWTDVGEIDKRPPYIEVYLLRDGENVGTARISEENNWRFDWTELEKYDESGSEIDWSVSEKKLEGYDYTVRLTQVGTTIVVTNTGVKGEYDPPPTPPVPDTGLLWWPVAVMGCLGLVCLIIGFKRRRSDR